MVRAVGAPRRGGWFAATLAVALLGCGGHDTEPTTEPVGLDGVSGEVVLTRQRDLLDRGLINVRTVNESGTSLLLTDIELIADFFEADASAPRTISLRHGRRVAIQVPYGVAVDCDTPGAVEAELVFTYRVGESSTRRPARVELTGTDLRTEQCTARRFDAAVRTRFEDDRIVDGTLTTTLVVEPTGAASGLAVTGVSGTILVRVDTDPAWEGVRIADRPVSISLAFAVNRCDPHALAEVTKRFGLDLAVAVGGDEPVPVPVDVAALVDDLEAIVQQCTDA